MALKLNFKFQRDEYTYNTKQENDEKIKTDLQRILNDNEITATHMYKPSKNSIKVIFPTDKEVDKVIENEEAFKNKNFEPKMSLSLKACRTIFCTHFDRTLLEIYDKNSIMEILKDQKWKVRDIYIMKSRKSFKIEMSSRREAQKFLKLETINIGGIQIKDESIEPEIDPTINQCWECGVLNPKHNSQNCTGRKICIKCGSTSHKFYECLIPKEIDKMTQQHKDARYCATCKTKASHTTLDHRQCPKKKNILRERASAEREKKFALKESNNKEIDMIRKALNFDNMENWPLPSIESQNPQNTKIATIVTLALLDEASTPGVFSRKMKEAFNNNGLQEIQYKLEENTARDFQKTLCGAHISTEKNASPKQVTSKYYNDQIKKKRNANNEDQFEENIDAIIEKEKTPRKIMINTQRGATAMPMTHKTSIQVQNHPTSSKTDPSTENMLFILRKELEKYIIMIETEDIVEKTETEIKTLSIMQILELFISNKIINNTEWTIRLKDCMEKLILKGKENYRLKVKIQKINMESIEISIIRATEQDRSCTMEDIYLDESLESLDDESEHTSLTNKSHEDIEDLVDRLINGDSSEENETKATMSSERISSYPLDYYVRNGTFSE